MIVKMSTLYIPRCLQLTTGKLVIFPRILKKLKLLSFERSELENNFFFFNPVGHYDAIF